MLCFWNPIFTFESKLPDDVCKLPVILLYPTCLAEYLSVSDIYLHSVQVVNFGSCVLFWEVKENAEHGWNGEWARNMFLLVYLFDFLGREKERYFREDFLGILGIFVGRF